MPVDHEVEAAAFDPMESAELRAWEARCREAECGEQATSAADDQSPWPLAEAKSLLDAIAGFLRDGNTGNLDAAADTWAATAPSTKLLVSRLACLREVLAEQGGLAGRRLGERLQWALDRVTSSATDAALAHLQDAALTDPLTGAGNRRALESAAKVALAQAARNGQDLSVIGIDLDGLKRINDTRGHSEGDVAISGLAAAIRGAMRDSDQLFRVGGDEFVALLPATSPHGIAGVIERARELGAPSFTWGAAAYPGDGTDVKSLLEVADSRLYEARRKLRDSPTTSRPSARRSATKHGGTSVSPGQHATPEVTAPRRAFPHRPIARNWRAGAVALVAVLAVAGISFALSPGASKPPRAATGSRAGGHAERAGNTNTDPSTERSGTGSPSTASSASSTGATSLQSAVSTNPGSTTGSTVTSQSSSSPGTPGGGATGSTPTGSTTTGSTPTGSSPSSTTTTTSPKSTQSPVSPAPTTPVTLPTGITNSGGSIPGTAP